MLYEDRRQHAGKHELKHEWWRAHGVEFAERAVALPFADYWADGSNVAVDTKADVAELLGNLGAGYRRLDHECARAAQAGYRIVFVCEGGARFADPAVLARCISPYCTGCAVRRAGRCRPSEPDGGCERRGDRRKPFQGYQMMGKMALLHRKHGAEFEFVDAGDSARRICELLGVGYDEGA